ncbi:MAG: tetratricopeptide repeat protein [Candidatus Heimdallarchaeota archaeon]|nr:tetratricopeptide repeat protein [Candidatus Heimdallarchaeota archaeon]
MDIQELFNIGSQAIQDGDFDKSLKTFLQANEEMPDNRDLLYGIAYCQRNLAMYDDAISTLNKVIELDKSFKYSFYDLGLIYYLLEDLQSAISSLEQAISLDPDFSDAIELLEKLKK